MNEITEKTRPLLAHPVEVGGVPIVSLDQIPYLLAIEWAKQEKGELDLLSQTRNAINLLRMGCPMVQIEFRSSGQGNFESGFKELEQFLQVSSASNEKFRCAATNIANFRRRDIISIDRKLQLRIGFVGYCPPTQFDEAEARRMIVEAYDQISAANLGVEITLVSGLTAVGTLKIAYEEATKRGWKTAGVACKRAEEHPLYPVDEKTVIGDNWGDESPTFLKQLDAMVRIGTGKQSIRETNYIKAQGKPTFEYNLLAL